MNRLSSDPGLPKLAQIDAYIKESPTIFTLQTRLINPEQNFSFHPGQFNMLYLYGIGEVPISISSDPDDLPLLGHTIRAVGRVTRAMQHLKEGDHIGIRGPYGRGWPVDKARNKQVLIVTGGLGCAPTVSVINYILSRRKHFGRLTILQGVKHSDDLIWRKQYEMWQQLPDTEVFIAADKPGKHWPWHAGLVTELIEQVSIDINNTIVLMCGPEKMMLAAVGALAKKNVPESAIYLSIERNMACAIGHCGHCQYGGLFVCKDGPVFAYPEIKPLFTVKGF